MARAAEKPAQRAEEHRAYRNLARIGLGARAVVYLFLGDIAAEIAAHANPGASDSSNGAFSVIARQPGGGLLLSLLASGLAAYGAWQAMQAAAPQPGGGKAAALRRLGHLASALVYFGLCAESASLVVGSQSSGPSQHPQPLVATVLRLTGGPELVGLTGVAVAAGGVALAAWGAIHDYGKVLRFEVMSGRMRVLARASGTAGDAARGAAVVLVGSYLVSSAVADDPARAKSLGGALQSVMTFTAGSALLALLAAGLICFTVYSLVEARYRRLGDRSREPDHPRARRRGRPRA